MTENDQKSQQYFNKDDIATIIAGLGATLVVGGLYIVKKAQAAKPNLAPTNLWQYPDSSALDYSVLSPTGKPSIRVTKSGDNMESNIPWMAIQPGKLVTFGCYIKTPGSAGGRIGIDLYDKAAILGISTKNGLFDADLLNNPLKTTVPAGSPWTPMEIKLMVLPNYIATGEYTPRPDGFKHEFGEICTPTGMIAWLQIWNDYPPGPVEDGQSAYFGDPYLYIE